MERNSFFYGLDEDYHVIEKYALPAVFSEWLFSTGFWDSVNEENGTLFQQYEEDSIGKYVATNIVNKLLFLKKSYVGMNFNKSFEFLNSWMDDGNRQQLTIAVKEIISGIDMAVFCISDLKNRGFSIECSF